MTEKKNDFSFFTHNPRDPSSLGSNAVLTVCNDKNGDLWIGTWRAGINIFNRRKQTFHQIDTDNYSIRKVFYLMRDSEDNMWVGTQSGGVSKYDWEEKRFYTYTHDPEDPKSLGDNDVLVIFEDSQKKVWIGTEFNGLNLLEEDENGKVEFQRYTRIPNNSESISNNCINHIFEDSKKNLWIATEGGLSKFIREKNHFKNYTVKDGLGSDHVKSIVEDGRGYLWIATAAGLSKFDLVKGTFRNYTHNDGLQHGEFSRYCVYKTRNGELVFGGSDGFNIFHPDSIRDNPYAPPVYLTGLKIFNIPVKVGERDSPLSAHISEITELKLSYKESVFSFDFVALNYTHPHMNQYAFKMEGFESDWNYVGNQRTATYTSLDPGEYVFHVKASNNDGLWNEAGTSIRVVITPPLWQTPLFKISLALVILGFIYLVIQYRVRTLNRINAALEEKVNERTFQLKKLINELQEKQKEVECANNELRNTHKQLELINTQLDKIVQERTSKLVKANQQLDRFVYSASHDLSAPLKSILGLINIVKLENYNEGLLQHLSHMEKSVLKLEVVIHHLTQFSRNMSPVSNKEFTFKEVVDEALDDLRYLAHTANIKVIKNFGDQDTMVSDFFRVKIVLTNLITNAIKYADKYKSENYVKISFTRSDKFYILEVEDNGIGIPEEYQLKVFDMFFRATTRSEGSGLGLYIVKDIVEKLEGKIEIDCNPGCFTVFKITLPVNISTFNKELFSN